MPNITLSVDEDVIRRVRKAAIDRHTTMTEMVRGFLNSVAERERSERLQAMEQLERTFETHSQDMSARTWPREDLHER